ncbi:MAG TPA: hypothetical protein VI488_17585 [Candidatus Angelobacter sp.]
MAHPTENQVDGLGANGKMVVIDATRYRIEVTHPVDWGRKSIQGWPAGASADSEDTLRVAELTGVRPMIEKFPLAKVSEASAHDERQGRVQSRIDRVENRIPA